MFQLPRRVHLLQTLPKNLFFFPRKGVFYQVKVPRAGVPKAWGHFGAVPSGSGCGIPLQAHLQLDAVAGVDGDVVGALQVPVQGQRGVIRGVNVALRVVEAHAAEH